MTRTITYLIGLCGQPVAKTQKNLANPLSEIAAQIPRKTHPRTLEVGGSQFKNSCFGSTTVGQAC